VNCQIQHLLLDHNVLYPWKILSWPRIPFCSFGCSLIKSLSGLSHCYHYTGVFLCYFFQLPKPKNTSLALRTRTLFLVWWIAFPSSSPLDPLTCLSRSSSSFLFLLLCVLLLHFIHSISEWWETSFFALKRFDFSC
jgi:hypothetical protein